MYVVLKDGRWATGVENQSTKGIMYNGEVKGGKSVNVIHHDSLKRGI